MNKYAIIAIAVLGAFFCFKGSKEPFDALIVGTNNEFPPFSFLQNGQTVGFDIDIAHEVCRRLDKPMVLENMPFEALLPSTLLGKFDFVAAGFTRTDEREKQVLFTKPYLNNDPLVIVSLKEKKIVELNKKDKITVNDGFTADLYLTEKGFEDLLRLPTVSDSILAMQSGRADAFVTALNAIQPFLKSQTGSAYIYTPIAGTAENCALVVPKEKHELLEKIQQALDEMESDGTIASLKEKWDL